MSKRSSRQTKAREVSVRTVPPVDTPSQARIESQEGDVLIGQLTLPRDVEATLWMIRKDVVLAKQYFDVSDSDDETIDDTLFLRNRKREREVMLHFFDKDDIDETLLSWYIRVIDQHVESVKGEADANTLTRVAFQVYIDLGIAKRLNQQLPLEIPVPAPIVPQERVTKIVDYRQAAKALAAERAAAKLKSKTQGPVGDI
jgi:hypothetical protein